MPPVASKPVSPFPAQEMVELLKQIEECVFNLVSASKKRGAKVRQEVVVLLKKYMDLLTEARRECMFFRNFHEILQDNLGNVKKVLETVRDGTVNDILAQLGLEKYGSYFEDKGIKDVRQLMKDSFRVEQLEQLNSGERERIQDKIKGLRDSFKGIKEATKEVHEMGERRYEACKGITEKFTTFLEDITKSREKISTLLADKPNKEETLTINYIIN
ncbi:PREDICTED: uncharacterized protein LOC109479082 [Branchiostoma belcheri]|uniref:Uncharacterized protein LOC109479082 n=1 Tax=Branchiostoma belcheri TaxID=7741 RepID=A0A6P4ZZY2_BRABE|nr:PREDICTED: uncharacterized protein LOC109479082 [Branchiostoma belcheri]